MKVWIQPEDGVLPVVNAIKRAKKSIQIFIFRFDRPEIERALSQAIERGVSVHALIAHTNRGGEKFLRNLEMRLLEAGATVARTADDLPRYHGKMLIVDKRLLYVFAFNFTYLDMERSRSFAVATKNPKAVQEAARLFSADVRRQPYKPKLDTFVVSPANSRKQLANFINAAKNQLLIYDPKVSDPEMVRLLNQRANAGVEVKIIGKLARKAEQVQAIAPPIRLHARLILRDQQYAFIGSQSLRKIELDGRRELGITFRDHNAVSRLLSIFHQDWNAAKSEKSALLKCRNGKTAKKLAKAVAQEVPPAVIPVLHDAIHQVEKKSGWPADGKQTEQAVKQAVKTVTEVLQGALQGENRAE